jgi:hypothetical protein
MEVLLLSDKFSLNEAQIGHSQGEPLSNKASASSISLIVCFAVVMIMLMNMMMIDDDVN